MSDHVPDQEDVLAQLFDPEILLDPGEGPVNEAFETVWPSFPDLAGDRSSSDHWSDWIGPGAPLQPDQLPLNHSGPEIAGLDAQPHANNELLNHDYYQELFRQHDFDATFPPMRLTNSDTFPDSYRPYPPSNPPLSLGLQWDSVAGAVNAQVNGDSFVDFTAHQYCPSLDDSSFQIEHASNNQTSDFQFVSGCRSLGPASVKTSDPAEPSSKVSKDSEWRCTFNGCKYKGTFNRKYDLKRHEKKHSSRQARPCPAVGCDYKSTSASYRYDKLGDHLIAKHDLDTQFMCFVEDCCMGPYTCAIFRLHLLNHYAGYRTTNVVVLARNLDKLIQKCPVKNCWCRRISAPGEPHILTHSAEERSEFADRFREKGYDASTGCVLCPICQDQAEDVESFAEHLELKHLTLDADHFTAWKAMYEKATGQKMPLRIWLKWHVRDTEKLKCPICPFQQDIPGLTDHHTSMMKLGGVAEEHAEQILRILPEFGTMPMFDEIMPKADQRKDGRDWGCGWYEGDSTERLVERRGGA